MKLTRRLIKLGLIAVLALCGLEQSARAGSITSSFAKVKIENLQPGRTYKVSKLFQPIIVVNATDDPCKMTMDLIRPKQEDIDPGFLPVPDVTWAALEKDRFEVPAWTEAVSDLFITVPKDEQYLGKKFQINIWTRSEGTGNIGVGLMHKLLFTVADKIDPGAGREPAHNGRFRLEPFEFSAMNIKFGRAIDLTEQSGTSLILRNPNKQKGVYRIEVINFDAAPILNLKTYEPAPSPEWLSTGPREIEVEGGKEKKIPLSIRLPRNPNYRNKKWVFLVRATLLNGEVPFSVVSRVYVTTSERLNDQ